MHPLGLLGGTFDCFHAGHLALVERGLVECEVLEIWLTSDALAQLKDARTFSWNERASDLLDSIGKAAAQRVSLHTLEDEDGPAPIHEVATAILCTLDTRAGCARINSMRAANDLPNLAVIEVEHVFAADGEPISSSRIRAGEIDREGLAWIPESARTGRIVLTPAVEAELKD
ncbi:MAG: adenylyltransferase/cytidyltransferase family protein, partial [Candidatus Poseidoniia archaeon]